MKVWIASTAIYFASLAACGAEAAGDQLRAQKAISLCLSRIENPFYSPTKNGSLGDQLEEIGARTLSPEDVWQAATLSLPATILEFSHSRDLLAVIFSRPAEDQSIVWAKLLQLEYDRIAASIKMASSRTTLKGMIFEEVSPSYVWLSTDSSMILSLESSYLYGLRGCTFSGLPKETAMAGLGEIAEHLAKDNRSYADGLTYEVKGPLSYFTILFLEFNRSFRPGERESVTVLTIRSNL